MSTEPGKDFGSEVPHDPSSGAQFADLCQRLALTSRKLEKRSLMAAHLRSLETADAGLAALYLAGQPFATTDERQLNVGGALLSQVLAQLTGAGQQAIHEAYRRHGDLGGAAFDLLNERTDVAPTAPTLTLTAIDLAFSAIAAETKPLAKRRLCLMLLERATPLEAKYLIKIILGDMRTGVKESLVEEAIAAAFEAGVAEIRRAVMLTGNTPEVVALAAQRRLGEAGMKLFHPLGFMLASPVETVEEALRRFSQELPSKENGGSPAEIRTETVTEALLEDKYDGIRAQVHCGDPEQPGRVALFSRSRENMTASFPELVEAFAGFPEPAILDGEILAWDPTARDRISQPLADPGRGRDLDSEQTLDLSLQTSEGRALPFTSLQPRLGRKRVTAEMRENAPVIFMAFDLLYVWNEGRHELMLERPLSERRSALEALVLREQARTSVGSRPCSVSSHQSSFRFEEAAEDKFPRLLLAPAVRLKSVEHLEQAYVDARARGNEGVMLKALHSTYQPGRRGLAWLKLKRELATLDVVVTAAEYGHGKRAGLLSDYTFAVRDGDRLRNVGKAYSGVTDLEIATLTEFFLEHTIEDFGFVRSVEPRIVLEVAFNNVMRSDRHDSGYALRFPRIVRIRDDKPVSEIDTLERVAEIYRSDLQSGATSGPEKLPG